MDDIEKIELIIKHGDVCVNTKNVQAAYLKSIAETQLLILKELYKLNTK